jgi:autophagy-related protein 11
VLLDEIGKMEEQGQNGSDNNGGLNGHFNVNSLGETRSRLEKLITRMDNLEPSFDKMVEKTSMYAL